MTEKDKEAIEQLKNWRNFIINNKDRVNKANDIEFYLRTALNLIQSQQEKIEKNKRLFSIQEKRKLQLLQRKDKEIEKKDKIIDLILEEIAFNYEINSSVDVVTIKRQLKEKFEKKVEGNNETHS